MLPQVSWSGPVTLSWGRFCSHRATGQHLETFLLSHLGEKMLRHWLEAGDAAEPPTVHRTVLTRVTQPQLSVEPTWRNPGRTTQRSWIVLDCHLLRGILGESLPSLSSGSPPVKGPCLPRRCGCGAEATPEEEGRGCVPADGRAWVGALTAGL